MRPERVVFLACGWSLARADAHGTSIALQDDRQTTVVDAGGDVAKQLARVDGLETLERIYLTHEHPDHVWSFPGLVHCLRFTGREHALDVAGPAPALTRAREAMDALGVTYPFDIEWRELEVSTGEDDVATWAPMDHAVPTLGYRFGDVTVLGDTSPTDTIEALAEGSSLLVHEASGLDEERCHASGHSTPSDAARAASRADVDTLALIHIHPSLPVEEAIDAAGFPHTIGPSDGDILRRSGEGWRFLEEP